MPFDNPIASFLSRPPRQQLVVPQGFRNIGDTEADYTSYEPDQPEPASVKALRGTTFDNDPVAAWMKRNPAPPQLSGMPAIQDQARRGIDRGLDLIDRPFAAVRSQLAQNVDPMMASADESQQRSPAMAALKRFGAGVNLGVAGLFNPLNAALMASTAGTSALARGVTQIGAGLQAGESMPEVTEGLKTGDYKRAAIGAGNVGLGLLGAASSLRGRPAPRALEGEVLDAQPAQRVPPSRQLGGEVLDADFTPELGSTPERRQLTGDVNGVRDGEIIPDDPIQRFLQGRPEPLQLSRDAGGPRQLTPPRRFIGGPEGPQADAIDFPADVQTLIGRENAPMTPEQFQRALLERGQPGPPLGSIDSLLLNREPATVEAAQPALPGVLDEGGLRRPSTMEMRRVGQEPPAPPPTRPELPPAQGGGRRAPQPGTPGAAPKVRALSEGEERGIAQLDAFLTNKYGTDDYPSVGNGLYRPGADTGLEPRGNPAERAPVAESGLAERGSATGRPARGRIPEADRTTPALAQQDLVDELVARASKSGYTGDPEALRGALNDRADLVRQIDAEVADAGGTPEALLRELKKMGGLSRTQERWAGGSGLAGELSWLRESLGGKNGVLRDSGGVAVDRAVEALQQDPRFRHIDSPNALIDELKSIASGEKAGAGPLTADRLGATHEGWWHELMGTEREPARPVEDSQIAGAGVGNYGQITPAREGGFPNEYAPPPLTEADWQQFDKAIEGQRAAKPNTQPLEDMLSAGEPAKGMTRLYRAGGDGRWFTSSLENARAYQKVRPGPLRYLDIDSGYLEANRLPGSIDPDIYLNSAEAAQSKILPQEPSPDILDTGEKQPRLPEAGSVRESERPTPQMEAPFSLAAEPATRTAVQPGLQQLEDVLSRVDEKPTAEFTAHRQDGTPEYIVKGGPMDRSTVTADTLRAEGIEVPQTPEFTGQKAVPANVASFLTKQLGYSPEQVNAMGFDEAIRVGRERVANPAPAERVAAAPPKIEPLPESRQLPSMRNFDELRQARGQQRKQRLDLTRVPAGPAEGGALPAPPKIQRLAREQGNRVSGQENPAGLSPRERGESPRQVTQRAAHMEKWMNDPTPENFARWVKEASGQAERVNEKQLRAGTSKEGKLPDKTDGGEFLASGVFPGAQLLANPKAMKAAAKMLLTSPAARAAIGAGIGYFNNDDPLQGAALGALIGAGLNKKLATETLKFLQQMVSKTAGGLTEGRGVKPVVYASDLSKDLHPLESQFASPMRAIPEQFKKAQAELDALDQLFHGRDELGKPLFNEEVPKTPAERALARKLYVGDAIKDLRKDAAKFHEAGQHRRAEYIEKIADVLKEKPPALNRIVRRTTGNLGEKTMNQLVRHMYRLQLGANIGVGLVNRTQKWYALRRVPYNYITNATKFVKTDAGKKATEFLTLEHPNDAPEAFSAQLQDKLNRADKILQSPLRTGDIQNRRVVYAAARQYAADKGGVETSAGQFDKSPEAVHRWAMDVTNETQTLPGAMGQNPFMRDLGAFSAYTKYPTMWAELMLDSMRNPDQRSIKMLAMIAGATGMLKTMGVDGIGLLIPRLIPGLGVGRAVVDSYKHLTGTADHAMKDDVPGLAIPGYVRKFTGELEAFGKYGTGEHKHLTPSGNVQTHSGLEALGNLLGVNSERQANERSTINEEMQRRNQRQIEQKEKSRDKREQQFERGQGQTLRERLRKSTPQSDRREFDQSFQGVR